MVAILTPEIVYVGGDFETTLFSGAEIMISILAMSGDIVSVEEPPVRMEVKVFPNPSDGIVQIQATKCTSPAMIQVLDQSGRLVHEESSIPLNRSFDFSHLANGKYFVSVLVDRAPVAVKAVVLK